MGTAALALLLHEGDGWACQLHHNQHTATHSKACNAAGHTHMLSLPKSRPHTSARLPGDRADDTHGGSHANAAASTNTAAAASQVERCAATAAEDFDAFPRRARGLIELTRRQKQEHLVVAVKACAVIAIFLNRD